MTRKYYKKHLYQMTKYIVGEKRKEEGNVQDILGAK